MAKSRIKNIVTDGSILKAILFLSVPIIFSNLLQTVYNITDTFWVGRLGAESVAAVSLSFPIIFFIISLASGIGLAGGVLASQYKGKKDKRNIDLVTGQTIFISMIFILVLSFLGYLFSPNIIKFLGAGKDVIPLAVSYLRISFMGLIFVFGFTVFQSIQRAVGDTKTPLYIILVTALLNLVLDPLFIFGYKFIPAMGVSGAAMATFVTQLLALLIGVILLSRKKGLYGVNLSLDNIRPRKKIIKKIIQLGIPSSIEQSSRSLVFIFIAGLAATFGTTVLAAYGIGMQILILLVIPSLSLMIVSSIIVGQNFGAKKIERAVQATKISALVGFISLTIIGLVVFMFSENIVAVFIPSDLGVIEIGSMFLKIISIFMGFTGLQMTLYGALRGSGNPTISMKIVLFTAVVQIISAFYLSKFTSLAETGIWISFPISNIVGSIIVVAIISKGNWKNKRIID